MKLSLQLTIVSGLKSKKSNALLFNLTQRLCNTKWAQIIRQDYEDAQIPYKWIEIGYHDLNKLYVKFGQHYPGSKNEKILGLELFDSEALQNFAKEGNKIFCLSNFKQGKVLLGSKEGDGGKWKVEAFFIVKGGTVKGIAYSTLLNPFRNGVFCKINIRCKTNYSRTLFELYNVTPF